MLTGLLFMLKNPNNDYFIGVRKCYVYKALHSKIQNFGGKI